MNTNADERINIGEDVIGSDGEKVGTVTYVVIRPPALHVTDFVVSTGGFVGRDVVLPVDQVDHIGEGKVYLRLDKDGLQKQQDYVEIRYQQPPEAWAPSGGFFYPAQSVLWPAGEFYPQPSSVTVNAPPGTVGLSEGMTVESSDGHKIGSVKALDEDPATGDITGLIIKEGFIFSHDQKISADLIAEIHADRLTLKVTQAELESQALDEPSS
jgi:uncharacterized protein YrrD